MFNPNADAAPINPLPKSVIILLCLVAFVEFILQLGERGLIGGSAAVGWRLELVRKYGFFDPIFELMRVNNNYNIHDLVRFFTFSFIHGSATHIIFILVFIAAIGKFVAEVYGDVILLIIFVFSGAIGALGYGVILNEDFLLIGGYPAVYGLIGAFTWVQLHILRQKKESGLKAFQLIGFFLVIQLVFKIVYSISHNDWLAEVIGFLTGFFIAFILSPVGKQLLVKIVLRLRN
jgi:membrane associated rhomboid family serine protease